MSMVQKNIARPGRLIGISGEVVERAVVGELGLKAIEQVYEPDSIVLEERRPSDFGRHGQERLGVWRDPVAQRRLRRMVLVRRSCRNPLLWPSNRHSLGTLGPQR